MKTINGLTLIEVLIALAIISIAMTAIIKSSSQNIKHTNHVEQKIIASLVAKNIANEIIAGLKEIPVNDALSGTTDMLNKKWDYKATSQASKNPAIKEITVTISANNSENQIYQLESFLYVSNN